MKHVKTIITTAVFALLCTTTFAQISISGGLSYGLEIEKLGIFARGSYDITDQLRGNATLNFFLGESAGVEGLAAIKTSLWAINLDGHYFLLDQDNFSVYALAGLNIASVRVKFEDNTGFIGNFNSSTTDLGINIGAGIELPLEKVFPFAELKYVVGGYDQLTIMLGARYPLGN
ncbi:MAG: outer membrane beta-barrel protein [Saprospiraceae bacterium]|nr:outer membrane beta-barrel protein [Saprospiraceae bacterium]